MPSFTGEELPNLKGNTQKTGYFYGESLYSKQQKTAVLAKYQLKEYGFRKNSDLFSHYKKEYLTSQSASIFA